MHYARLLNVAYEHNKHCAIRSCGSEDLLPVCASKYRDCCGKDQCEDESDCRHQLHRHAAGEEDVNGYQQ
jgi:hypothetical protein